MRLYGIPGINARGFLRAVTRCSAVAALAVICALSLMGARKTMMGLPLGNVMDVDGKTGAVSVDLGAPDGVLKGVNFAVVDAKGHQMAIVTPAEVYDDLFWSKPLPQAEATKVRPGMEVRWLLTPELSLLLRVRRTNTPDAYREFAAKYPKSVFLAQLVRLWPDETLKAVDPAYYDAWKAYTVEAFEGYIANHPGGGFAGAAKAEIDSIKAYEAGRERERKQRDEEAARYEEEQKRKEQIREQALARKRQAEAEEMHGKLVNNSSQPVRFVFDPPSTLPATVVQPGAEYEVNQPEGSYTYKVYAIPAEPEPGGFVIGGEDTAPEEPLAEGSVDIMFDFWSVEYP